MTLERSEEQEREEERNECPCHCEGHYVCAGGAEPGVQEYVGAGEQSDGDDREWVVFVGYGGRGE